MIRLRGANWYAGCIFHSADLRVVTNVHETATWWSVMVRNGAGCVPTRPLPLPAKGSGIIYPSIVYAGADAWMHFMTPIVKKKKGSVVQTASACLNM